MSLDSQQIELIGRNLLVAQLLADDLEVALPERDRGIDLIVYADVTEQGRFVARPIQLKAASRRAFLVDQKYGKFPDLLLAYVWNVAEPLNAQTFCLTQLDAVGVAHAMGWIATASWERGAYSTSRPSSRLVNLLAPFEMSPGMWRERLGLTAYPSGA
ncbi:MAG: hypothetical protein ACR2HP_10690 [Ilumatobacteraceae bacterium]